MKTRPAIRLIAIAITAISTLHAEETSPSMKLIEVLDPTTTAVANAEASFEPVLGQMKAQGLPPEAMTEIKAAANEFFTKSFADPAMKEQLAEVYEKNFTEEEIGKLLEFYETPIGKKTLANMPEITKQSMAIGQQAAMKNQGDFQQKIQAIMTKYQAPAPEAPAPAPAPAPEAPAKGE